MSILSKRFRKEIAPLPPGVDKVTELISKKWIIDILFILHTADMSFTELRNELKEISNQELAKKLKILESHKLVEKQASFLSQGESNHVYISTVSGKDLCDLIMNMNEFGQKYLS
ncbi:MAG: winged helix-turn-helix transcriptional regulator [Candidatus Thorarchaeota archaeon]